ncbi:MAG: pyruvate kinase [Bacillota bacterium]|jgi:pyruvate kinase|nr:pyruvate kinase [Bacillota bacterium]HOK71391.1 pyruvate kinase [Bacillota bacterium]HOO30671.1 pyruvate kinase [Bacillota bacterium]HPQ02399.1 pyruvate kinase [Bacillota bacterium]HPZ14130.1 pyruvate kinase [Bacillota bacterium]
MRKTKIVCTIGPASDDLDTLRSLANAGMDVARLNFSHGVHEEHAERIRRIRAVAAECGKNIPIMLDTKGPELRIGAFESGSITLAPGDTFIITTQPLLGNSEIVSVNYPGLPILVSQGDKILLDDGQLEMEVRSVKGPAVECEVIVGGVLSDRKRLSVPGRRIDLPTLSSEDKMDLAFGIEHGIDIIAASFIRTASSVQEIKSFTESRGVSLPVIAKIESREGIENINSILRSADGLMVARGDLGVELPAEDVPIIQKQLIQKCRRAGKPVITATQMLDSMIRNPHPTRAEVSDVANAVLDGTDAVMLSGETASGKYPVESVRTMARVVERTETAGHFAEAPVQRGGSAAITATDAIGHATVQIATELKAAAIITSTKSGWTARMIAKHRPKTPIVAVATDEQTARILNLVWGVYPVQGHDIATTDEMISTAVAKAQEAGFVREGDTVIITAGVPVGMSGTTNLIKVHEITG